MNCSQMAYQRRTADHDPTTDNQDLAGLAACGFASSVKPKRPTRLVELVVVGPWSFPLCVLARRPPRPHRLLLGRGRGGRLIQVILNGRPGIVDDLLGGAADQSLRHGLQQSAKALDLRDPLDSGAGSLRRQADRGLDLARRADPLAG